MISTCPTPDSCHNESKFEKVLTWINLLLIVTLIVGCVTVRGTKTKLSGLTPKESGLNVIFYNPTNVSMVYDLMWVDHPFDNSRSGPRTMAAGELKPGKFNMVDSGYRPGLWVIEWRTGNTPNQVQITSRQGLIVDPGDFLIVSTPVHAYCKKGCDFEAKPNEINVFKIFKVGE